MYKILVFHTRTYKRYTVYGRNELSELIDIPVDELPSGPMWQCQLGEWQITECQSS